MGSLVRPFDPAQDRTATGVEFIPEPGVFDPLTGISAGFRAARAGPDWGLNQVNYEGRIAASLLQEARKRGYRPPLPGIAALAGLQADIPHQRAALIDFINKERQRDPAFLPDYADIRDADGLVARARADRRRDLERANADLAALDTPSYVIGVLGGGLGAGALDPLSYIPVGGGVGTTVARQILSTALREGAANVALTVASEPLVRRDAETLGIDRSNTDFASDVAVAGLFGGGLGAAGEALPHVLRGAFGKRTPPPDVADAAAVIGRETEIDAASPFVATPDGDADHRSRLAAVLAAIDQGAPLPETTPPLAVSSRTAAIAAGAPDVVPVTGPAARARLKQRIRIAESSGNDRAQAGTSSASGRYQFTRSTFIDYYRREYRATNMSDDAIWSLRFEPQVQEKLVDRLINDNAELLSRAGHDANAGNLYLLHFLGPKGLRLLESAPGTSVNRLLPAEFIVANRTVLAGRSAGEVIAWAHRKMGETGPIDAPVVAAGGPDIAVADAPVPSIRADAFDGRDAGTWLWGGERPSFVSADRTYAIDARHIQTDPVKFQFKGGGDKFGVTGKLAEAKEWVGEAALPVFVWESADGALYVADGHQRTGLAKRLIEEGKYPDGINVQAIVWREADGIDARNAMVRAAAINVMAGTASALDIGRLLRMEPNSPLYRGIQRESALWRQGEAISRLNDEAFKYLLAENMPDHFGAMVGRYGADLPAEVQVAMLAELNRGGDLSARQTESIVQEMVATPARIERTMTLFGEEAFANTLLREKAAIRTGAIDDLKRQARLLTSAAKGKKTLEQAGSTIAADEALRAAIDSGRFATAIQRLSVTPGNGVFEALNRAARAHADGGSKTDAIQQFLDALGAAKDDLVDELGGNRRSGNGGNGGNQPGPNDAAVGEIAASAESAAAVTAAELEAAGQTSLFGDPATGPAATAQTQSLLHDLTDTPPDGVFRLSDEGDPINFTTAMREAEADEAAAAAARACLSPAPKPS